MSATPPGPPIDVVPRPTVGRVFEETRRVRLGDVSPGGRLRLDAATRYLQDLSADDTADAALPDAEAWVVRKTVMEVRSFPRYLEALELATWCSGTGSHWAERRISVVGERGGDIDAITTWVHFDRTSGRPRRVPEGFDAIYGEASGGRRVKARLTHPAPPADAVAVPWPLRYTDFDVLAHVNNAAYWEVVEEALSSRRELRAPLWAEVEHHTPVDRGSTVEVVTLDDGDGVALWVLSGGAVAASARVQPISW